jgi:gluconolactonase
VQVLDERFTTYRLAAAAAERLATGFCWVEGPAWFGDGRFLLFSDIPNNRIMRCEEETAAVSVFRKPSKFANRNTRDLHGRLVTCEHDTRRVTRQGGRCSKCSISSNAGTRHPTAGSAARQRVV